MSSKNDKDYESFKSFLCLLIIVLFAVIGRIIVIIFSGYNFPKFFHKFKCVRIKPTFTKFKLPHLLGEILFGIIARNAFTDLMEDYNPKWGEYCRMICLSILLLGGGMHLDLKGKGLVVILLVLFAPTMEAISISLLGVGIFSMNIALGLALGFAISAASPAVLVPPMMQLQFEGYGVEKGIPTTLIAASSLQDVSVIICFGIFSAISLNEIKKDSDSILKVIIKIAYELAAGIAAGIIIGYMIVKFIITVIIAIAMVLTFELTGFPESKYLSVITFGLRSQFIVIILCRFICRQNWGKERPDHYINILFIYMTPFLFGTVGASMVFADLQGSNIGYAILIIIIGCLVRYFSTIVATMQKKFAWPERIFMGFAWLPKATVQAALGGYILEKAQNENNEEYIDFGNKILTVAIFSILLTAPLGAIATLSFCFFKQLYSALGKKLLPQRILSITDNDGGFIINEQEEQLIEEMLFQEFPGVEIDESIKTGMQLSITKSNMRRQRLRNLIQDPDQPNHHFILTTHQPTQLTEQQQAILEENEFGLDISIQNRPRIKSGEFQQPKLSTVDQDNSESIATGKQRSRRNSMTSLSRRSSYGSISSIALSVGDINEQQLDQIHQINKKWREQKVQHMKNIDNDRNDEESYDTWERSIDDELENQKTNHQGCIPAPQMHEFNELEHQLSPGYELQQIQDSQSDRISSEAVKSIKNYKFLNSSQNQHLSK